VCCVEVEPKNERTKNESLNLCSAPILGKSFQDEDFSLCFLEERGWASACHEAGQERGEAIFLWIRLKRHETLPPMQDETRRGTTVDTN